MASIPHSTLYNLRLFDSAGEEENFLREYTRQVRGDGVSPLKELTLQQFIEDQAVQARASGYLLVTFDDYGLLVGILLALMMVLPALYHYYYKCDKYSLVMRNARKAAKVE
ncbi:hypothetical protein TYRP_013623 [Tyrophagus putrescentiae]|nr:hypothetical protein TYRP_013623 [Tyrophagus putrescentiae]